MQSPPPTGFPGGQPGAIPNYPYPPYLAPPNPALYAQQPGIPGGQPGAIPNYPYPPYLAPPNPALYAQQPGQPIPDQPISGLPYQMFFRRPKTTSENFEACDFEDASIRNNFIRKVYLILFAQLALSASFIAITMLTKPICPWTRRNPAVGYASYAVFFSLYITLVCCPSVRRSFPGNYLSLLLFTIAFTYVAGAISCAYKTFGVLTAIGITAVTCLAVSIFAITTKIDFTKCTTLFLFLSIALLVFGIACVIVYATLGPKKLLHTVYGGVAACVFALYLGFDTQMIIGGRYLELSAEEYIYGALQLYMDVMNLFLSLLGLSAEQN